jgi:hypothetical protein
LCMRLQYVKCGSLYVYANPITGVFPSPRYYKNIQASDLSEAKHVFYCGTLDDTEGMLQVSNPKRAAVSTSGCPELPQLPQKSSARARKLPVARIVSG